MELGVGEALVSVLDEKGVPGMVQRTAIICPQSLMAPCDQASWNAALEADGMAKYDEAVDSESAFEVLEKRAALDAERAAFEAEKAAFEAQKAKEEEAERKRAEKAAEAAQKKFERDMEREEARRQKEADRRKAKIESQLISAGGQILKRGLMGTLFGGSSSTRRSSTRRRGW